MSGNISKDQAEKILEDIKSKNPAAKWNPEKNAWEFDNQNPEDDPFAEDDVRLYISLS
jgi:hypothetical protein